MTQLLRLLILGFIVSTVISAQSQQRNIGFSVFDEIGQFVKGVKGSDVRLRIDKKDVAVESVNEMSDQALDLIILLDRSISQETGIEKQKAAVTVVIQAGLRPGRDRVAIGSFAGTLSLDSDLSDDMTTALKVLPTILVQYPPGYMATPQGNIVFVPPGKALPSSAGTAIWDSIFDAAKALGSASSGTRRKAILVFSDGFNTAGTKKRAEAMTQAGLSGVAVFFLGIGDPKFVEIDRKGLKRFAEESNGVALFPNKKLTDLNDISIRIVELMRSCYSLTYSAPARGGEIQITLPTRKDVNVSQFGR